MRKEMKTRQNAATLIQNQFRKYSIMKKYKQERASSVIQAFFKMIIAKKVYHAHKRRVQAAIIIQKYTRRMIAINLQKNKGLIIIQV